MQKPNAEAIFFPCAGVGACGSSTVLNITILTIGATVRFNPSGFAPVSLSRPVFSEQS